MKPSPLANALRLCLATACTAAAPPLLAADDAYDTISVTASRIERGTKEVSSSISVIDEQRIEAARMFNIKQVCRYLVKDFGTFQSPKSTRQRDSRYCPDRPALITTPSRTLQ
ncbi:MAG: hypothetical protein AB2813_09560, partial [Candidatus Sedimenticola endophacoides]